MVLGGAGYEAAWGWAFLVALVILTGAVAVAYVFWLRSRRRLARLTEAARRVANGDFSFGTTLTDKRHDEIGALTDAFRRMAAAVAEREAALREADGRTRSLIDSAASAIVTFDAAGRIESINRTAARLLGYAPQELSGRDLSLLLPTSGQGQPDVVKLILATTAGSEFGGGIEVSVRPKDCMVVPVHLSVAPVKFSGKELYIAVMTDLTEIKKTEQAKDNLVSVVSHELRTPLTAIHGALSLVRAEVTGQLPDKMRAMIDIAHGNADRLLRIINDILDMEKIKSGKLDYEFRTLDLGPLLDQAVVANQAYAEQFDVDIVLGPVPAVSVAADSGRLTQALTNLLSNGIKVSEQGGSVFLDTKFRKDTVRISVTDQGPGIPAELRERIFEDFFQSDSAAGRTKLGTGLGLGIARTIIRDHGGSINLVSEVGRGTTFYIDLPVARQAAVRSNEAANQESADSGVGSAVTGG